MTDANGLPLSLVVAGANTHDIKLVADTLDALQTGRPGRRLHLCMDKGYEAEWLEACLKNRRYEPHIQSRKEESEAIKSTDFKAHRWVVERTHSWMNRFRRVLTLWEKKVENYVAMLYLTGFAPIFPDICYHLTHYKPAAADIPVASDNPAHYADAIRYNARTPLQGSLLPLTRLVWA